MALPAEIQERVRQNIVRAIRLFRSHTLPYPGSTFRLSPTLHDLPDLSAKIDDAIFDGIDDDAARDRLLPPVSDPAENRARIKCGYFDSNQSVEDCVRRASNLLGKFWYRHQERDIF